VVALTWAVLCTAAQASTSPSYILLDKQSEGDQSPGGLSAHYQLVDDDDSLGGTSTHYQLGGQDVTPPSPRAEGSVPAVVPVSTAKANVTKRGSSRRPIIYLPPAAKTVTKKPLKPATAGNAGMESPKHTQEAGTKAAGAARAGAVPVPVRTLPPAHPIRLEKAPVGGVEQNRIRTDGGDTHAGPPTTEWSMWVFGAFVAGLFARPLAAALSEMAVFRSAFPFVAMGISGLIPQSFTRKWRRRHRGRSANKARARRHGKDR